MRARVLVKPKAGILDPQGQAVERALPALGFTGVQNVHVGRLIELDVEDPSRLPEMCERLLSNPLIEDYEIVESAGADSIGIRLAANSLRKRMMQHDVRRQMRFGVIRFPGSCDDVDALLAAQRVGDAVMLWHADRDLQGVDAVVVPGGFSYGDYLRAGAIARFAPVMEEVAEFAREGGLVLGICNGFQVLCEAGLLPGALLPNTTLKFVFRQVELDVVDRDTPFTRACEQNRRLSIPVKHTTGRYYARSGPCRAALRDRAEPERIPGRYRRCLQRSRRRRRSDAAPGARGGSADRLHRRAEDLRVDKGAGCRRRPRLSIASLVSPTTSTS